MRMMLLLMLSLFCAGVACAGAGSWESFGFDGKGFVKGSGASPVMVKDGFLPIAAASSHGEDQLPEGTGAVALLCYQERSGGKLKAQHGIAPISGMMVTLKGAALALAGRTNHSGYLVLALPPGDYQVRWLGFTRSIRVEKGKTALAALRGGKRMVD